MPVIRVEGYTLWYPFHALRIDRLPFSFGEPISLGERVTECGRPVASPPSKGSISIHSPYPPLSYTFTVRIYSS